MGTSCETRRSQSGAGRRLPGWTEVETVLDRLAETGDPFPFHPTGTRRIASYQRDRRLMLDSESGSRWIALADIRECWETFERLGTIRREDVLEPGRSSAFMMALFAQVPGVAEGFDRERFLVLPA
jgi:hypothetical protein